MNISKIRQLAYDQLLYAKGLKKSWIARRINTKKSPIKLYWWNDYGQGIANFGDELTKEIIENIFGYKIIFAVPEEAEMVGAGSIIEIVSRRNKKNVLYVWGSGFMWRNTQESGDLDGLRFVATRGRLSRERIVSSNGKYIGLAIGDPGLLSSVVYKPSKTITDSVGVVAHFVDADNPLVEKLRDDSRFMIINPLDSPEEVAKKITSCRLVLSSSLHGLIVADSFSIPNTHIQFSDKVAGGSYKFEDYYSSTDRDYVQGDKNRIFEDAYLKELQDKYHKVGNLTDIQRKLVKSFPEIR